MQDGFLLASSGFPLSVWPMVLVADAESLDDGKRVGVAPCLTARFTVAALFRARPR